MSNIEKKIRFGLYVFIFLLPLQTALIIQPGFLFGQSWWYGNIALYATEVFLWILLIFGGVLLIQKRDTFSKPWGYDIKFFILTFLFGFIAWSLTCIVWAEHSMISYWHVFRLTEAVALCMLLLRVGISKGLLNALFASGIVQSLVAVFQIATQTVFSSTLFGVASKITAFGGTSVVETSSGRFLRAYGTLPDPNILGGFLSITLLVGVFLYFQSTKKVHMIFYKLAIGINALGLFVTFSRGAWLGAFVGLCLLFFSRFLKSKKTMKQWNNKTIIILFFLVILFGSFSFVFRDIVTTRFHNETRLEVRSVNSRVSEFFEAQQIIAKHPVRGVGFGMYPYEIAKLRKNAWEAQPVHNIFLLILTELGLIGSSVLLFFCCSVLLYALKHNNAFGISMFFAVLIFGMFDHYLITTYFGLLLFWFVCALVLQKKTPV